MTRYFAIVTSNYVFIAESGAVMPTGGSETGTRRIATVNAAPRAALVATKPLRRSGAAADDHGVSTRPATHRLGHERNRTHGRNKIATWHKGDK